MNLQISERTDIWTYRYLNLQISEPTVIWNYIYLNLQLSEPTDVWIYRYLNIQIYESTYIWTYRYLNLHISEPSDVWTYIYLNLHDYMYKLMCKVFLGWKFAYFLNYRPFQKNVTKYGQRLNQNLLAELSNFNSKFLCNK